MELTLCMKALGDPTRFTIFQQLLLRKHCTRSLARNLGISESAVSQHLKILREAGMVYREKYGYHTHYLPEQAAVDFLADAFARMQAASRSLNRDPQNCQCEYRQQMEQLSAPIPESIITATALERTADADAKKDLAAMNV